MSVRAKFTVSSIKPNGGGVEIDMMPVVSGSPENEQFFGFTPWGSIKLGTVNTSAAEQFEAGKEYYVDFTPAN